MDRLLAYYSQQRPIRVSWQPCHLCVATLLEQFRHLCKCKAPGPQRGQNPLSEHVRPISHTSLLRRYIWYEETGYPAVILSKLFPIDMSTLLRPYVNSNVTKRHAKDHLLHWTSNVGVYVGFEILPHSKRGKPLEIRIARHKKWKVEALRTKSAVLIQKQTYLHSNDKARWEVLSEVEVEPILICLNALSFDIKIDNYKRKIRNPFSYEIVRSQEL